MLKFHLVTLFQDACDAYLSASILGRARENKKISVSYQNPRDFVDVPKGAGKFAYRKVDDRPYGGGPGMVMQAMPIIKAVQKALKGHGKRRSTTYNLQPTTCIVWFSPSGKQFTNKDADALAKYDSVVLVCGRYEGIDERAKKILKTLAPIKTFAVGEAVYTGGEVPAMAIVDAVTRRIPGVLGKDASVEERRIAASEVFTRPETILYKKKKYRVPKVLQTGNHAQINAWREKR
ncbi:MAG TPA: tRNA (guanosine(37)-N1)-methyltransferase TrmD [Candidatus Paceibacterota bacterium]|nr:tRNA (guanosine(37)-N1)-methyltransferase TrmD [Candidatus Paceibacterota bacterium]